VSVKQDRMNWRIRTILSELIRREVSDPRLQNLTVTAVDLDQELQYARVYVNALGDESRQKQVMAGLESAKGFLRREVGKRVRLRKTPELEFRWDATLAEGDRIDRLISQLDIPPAEENDPKPELD
jgi:ribosome-binding factor A